MAISISTQPSIVCDTQADRDSLTYVPDNTRVFCKDVNRHFIKIAGAWTVEVFEIAATSSQPDYDQSIPQNSTTVIYDDPLIPTSGTAIILSVGSLLSLSTTASKEVASNSSQPLTDQTIPENNTMVIFGDPCVPASGVMVCLNPNALLVLDPYDGNSDFWQCNNEPAQNIRIYPGNNSFLFEQPLILDLGIVYEVGRGSLVDLDASREDQFSNFSNCRPGKDTYIPDYMSADVAGPLILDSGRLYSLVDSGTGGYALLNVM